MKTKSFTLAILFCTSILPALADNSASDTGCAELAKEVANKGWIVYCARTEGNGAYDLFICRPDGTHVKNITNTLDFEEAIPRFSLDGKKLLYRRMNKGTVVDHGKYGFQGQLILADSNGSNPIAIAEEGQYNWAVWSPDTKQIASLTNKELQIVDLSEKKIVRSFPRQGTYWLGSWSPDGNWLCGVGNPSTQGMWTIVRIDVNTGNINSVREFQNCTPDWFPDSKHIIFSSRPANQPGNGGHGWTQLWMAEGEGTNQKMIFGEDGVHIYGGALSPDGKYVLFTKCPRDGGDSEGAGAPVFLMRLEDAPTIKGESIDLRKVHPEAKDCPVLDLGIKGWEPEWTYAEIIK